MISVGLVNHDLYLPGGSTSCSSYWPGMISVGLVDHDLYLPRGLSPALHTGQV
jgi:hypothetical protein